MNVRDTLLIVSMAPGDALRSARRAGVLVCMLTDQPTTWQRELLDDVIVCNPYDSAAAASAALHWCDGARPRAILTYDERAVPATAVVAEAIGVPYHTRAAACAARNKYLMRQRFAADGLRVPNFALARSFAEARDAARGIVGYPLVLKPLFGSGSQGVVRIDSEAELERLFPLVLRIAASHVSFAGDDEHFGALLLEEYLPGREIAVDAILADELYAIGIFDKPQPLEGPTFEETIYVTPSREEPAVQAAIYDLLSRGAAALGLDRGPVHGEVRITEAGAMTLLEIGARPIGGVCGRAHSYCLGVDYHDVILRHALGEPLPTMKIKTQPSGVMMLPVPATGRLEAVEGVEHARSIDGVRDVLITAKPGDLLVGFPEQGCYVGFIVATGTTPLDVEQSLLAAQRALDFRLSPVDGGIV